MNAGSAGISSMPGKKMEDFVADVNSTALPDQGSSRSREAANPWSFNSARVPERPVVEAFMRRGFEQAYGARLAQFMPELMVLRRHSDIAAACGLRPAAFSRLFVEIYLDAPIETVLSAAADPAIARADITEVGNLVIAQPGYARRLIAHLAAELYARGCCWVVFSAVPALRNSFRRLGIPLVALGPASAARLTPRQRARWGTYYDHLPVVTAVNVAGAFQAVCETECIR